MSCSSSSLDSDKCQFYAKTPYQNNVNYCPFDPSLRQPFVYFVRNHRGNRRSNEFKKSNKRNNYFEKAFKWYTKDLCCAKRNQCGKDFPGFATWLDTKYDEYLHSLGEETDSEWKGGPIPKYDLNNKNTRKIICQRSFEVLLEPKDITSRAASVCYFHAATAGQNTDDSSCINKKCDRTKTCQSAGCQNRVFTSQVIKGYDTTTISVAGGESKPLYKRNMKLIDVECECDLDTVKNVECQCPVTHCVQEQARCPEKCVILLKDQQTSSQCCPSTRTVGIKQSNEKQNQTCHPPVPTADEKVETTQRITNNIQFVPCGRNTDKVHCCNKSNETNSNANKETETVPCQGKEAGTWKPDVENIKIPNIEIFIPLKRSISVQTSITNIVINRHIDKSVDNSKRKQDVGVQAWDHSFILDKDVREYNTKYPVLLKLVCGKGVHNEK